VKYMLGSPKAVGKFAAAMAFSNIGGIGRYAGYDNLLPIATAAEEVYEPIVAAAGCSNCNLASGVSTERACV
jgi:hypothetical protein